MKAKPIIAGVLFTMGLAVIGVSLTQPAWLNQTYQEIKTASSNPKPTPVTITNPVTKNVETVTPVANINLGQEGGTAQLDKCDGTFTEMTEYKQATPTPWYSAHNNCEGHLILPLQPQQHHPIRNNRPTKHPQMGQLHRNNTPSRRNHHLTNLLLEQHRNETHKPHPTRTTNLSMLN